MTDILSGARVLITGASSGIGRELARQIAATAAEIIVVARRVELLGELARELTDQHPRLVVRQEPCDLLDEAAIDRLADSVLVEGPVDVVVNNAGIGYEEVFDRADWQRVRNLLQVNIIATAHLTARLLPPMVAQGRGALLFIGSGAGHAFMPRAAAYAGSKHFVDGFVESLRIDLTGTGVIVTQVAPGPVDTEFDALAGTEGGMAGDPPGQVRISAEECARDALRGLQRGRALVFPGRRYRALMRAALALPLPVRRAIFSRPGRVLSP